MLSNALMGIPIVPLSQRAERAQVNRKRMREVALRLFRERGYVGTPMQAIADEAGVPVHALYVTFGTKRALLRDILQTAAGGDEPSIAVVDRLEQRALIENPCPFAQLRGQARLTRLVYGRLGPVLEVVRGAASGIPDIAELWEASIAQRTEAVEHLIAALAAKAPLRPGVDQAAAVDIALGLQGLELYQFLVDRRGWSPGQYERWLAGVLISELLGIYVDDEEAW
jgi:AcrR family transcriptional regulator